MTEKKIYSIRRKPFFADQQVKRYMVQILSMFAGFQVRSGKQRDGKHRMLDVPVIYGGNSRAVNWILGGGNENVVNALPIISVDLVGLRQRSDLRRFAGHTEKIYYDELVGTNPTDGLGTEKGDRKVVERHMPVPYQMDIRVYSWSSNYDQVYQIAEQLMTYFNPDVDIQLGNSPADWASRSVVTFEGDVEITRTGVDIGAGTGEDSYYVSIMGFNISPVWISPPVKVYDAKEIQEIHLNILELNDPVDFDTMDQLDDIVITGSN